MPAPQSRAGGVIPEHPADQVCRWCDDLDFVPKACPDCGHDLRDFGREGKRFVWWCARCESRNPFVSVKR